MYYRATAYHQPKTRYSAEQVANWCEADANFIIDKIGIKERAFLGETETTADMAEAAVRSLFDREKLLPEQVDLLIVVTQSPDYQMPHTAALLQDRLGLPTSCASLDLSLGCSGFVYAMSVARGLMQCEGFQNAVLVTADPYSKVINRHDRNTVAVFGDAAAASWLSGTGGEVSGRIGRGDFGTDGSGAKQLILEKGGAAHPAGGLFADKSAPETPSSQLFMDGRAIFNFMMERVPNSVNKTLEKNSLTMDDIDFFVFHQASKFLLDNLGRQIGIAPEKLVIELENFGNTVSSTIPIALAELIAREEGLNGRKVLISGFGVGLSWASNILTFSSE